MATIRLDPMTENELETYLDTAVTSYAEVKVSAGNWPEEGSLQRAVHEFAELLPDGVATSGHHLYTARDGDLEVGVIWFAERPHGSGCIAYIYDVAIEPELRGRGYGEAVMRSAEREVRSAGLDTVQLHVFAQNSVARSLYRGLGYVETNIVMAKALD